MDSNGEFTALSLKDRAFSGHDITDIHGLEFVIGFLAHFRGRKEVLHRTRAITNRGESGLTHYTLEHHTAGNRHLMGFGFEFFGALFAVSRTDVTEQILSDKVIGISVTRFTPLGDLSAALCDDMVFIFGRNSGFLNLGGGQVFVLFTFAPSLDALLEASLNKLIKITVQHSLRVAGFHISS